MKQALALNLPRTLDPLVVQLNDHMVRFAEQLNGVTEGRNAAFHNGQTTAPTTGTYAQGDFIRNSTPTEAGSASSKYVVLGWICTVGGTPGTFLPCRALTGN